MSDYQRNLEKDLVEGWAEITAGGDRISNTKILITKINEASKALNTVISSVINVGGPSIMLAGCTLIENLHDLFEGQSAGAVTMALAAHLSTRLERMREVCVTAVEGVESNA